VNDLSKLALVLAGGGGKGAYQIGVWKALRQFGVDQNIGAIAGTSVGALNATAFLQGDLEIAEKIWMSISHEKMLTADPFKMVQSLVRMIGHTLPTRLIELFVRSKVSNGIFSREGLVELMDQYINLEFVSSSPIPCYVTCCHLPSFQPTYFEVNGMSKDEIKSVLLASSALPVVYDHETINGKTYIDGGVVDNVPLSPLYDSGFRNFLVVHLSQDSIINTEKFPDSHIIQIVPSKHQGEFIDGTLDFNASSAKRRMKQGYEDAIKILQPIYDMGMVQRKISHSLQRMQQDNDKFLLKREELLHTRKDLKAELHQLLEKKG